MHGGCQVRLRVTAVRLEEQEAVKDPGRSPASLRGGRVVGGSHLDSQEELQ